jgi:hypothetical protein
MNTASKNNQDNVIGASSSLVHRRTTEMNVQLVKQNAAAFKPSSKRIHLLHFSNTYLLTIPDKDKGQNTLQEEHHNKT